MRRIFLEAEDGRQLKEDWWGKRDLRRLGPRCLATSVPGWMWDWKRQRDEHQEKREKPKSLVWRGTDRQ